MIRVKVAQAMHWHRQIRTAKLSGKETRRKQPCRFRSSSSTLILSFPKMKRKTVAAKIQIQKRGILLNVTMEFTKHHSTAVILEQVRVPRH